MNLPEQEFKPIPKLKVWFNPGKGWFEVYMPDGQMLPSIGKVTVSDSLDRGESPKMIMEASVEVVNERPEQKPMRDAFIVKGEDLKRMI